MAILNYGAYYLHKKDNSEKKGCLAERPHAFDKLKEDWNKREENPFEHRSKEQDKTLKNRQFTK